MKKLLSLFVALLTTITLWAQMFQSGDLYYNVTSTSTVEVIYRSLTSPVNYNDLTSVVIPNSVEYKGNTYIVTSISMYAFQKCPSLTSVTIGNSVTSIGDDAFQKCPSLTSVTIGNSVTNIGGGAFADCSSLTSVTIGNSVTSIGSHAFFGCSSLTSIVIPEGVTSIELRTFEGCSSLTSITLPNSVTSIGDQAFYLCESLTSVTLGNSVTSIGDYAFCACKSLSSINIPNSVTSIGGGAFNGCALTSLTIPNSMTSIEEFTFSNCHSLTSLTISNSVTTIGRRAFSCCCSLTSVTLGDGLTSIGADAFDCCRNLEEIYCYPITPPAVESPSFHDNYSKATLYVPCDSKEAYEEHPVFGKFKKIRGIDGCGEYVTTHIYDTICQGEVYEFGGCLYDATGTYTSTIDLIPTYLYLTVLPSPTVTITVEANDSYIWHDEVYTESGEYKYVTVAANGCDSTEVLLLTIISSDEDEANSPNKIYYTSSDGNIVNPTNPNGFGANIISNTYENGQGVITFDGLVTSIGDYSFFGCSSLSSITLGSSVTNIGDSAFVRCYSLDTIYCHAANPPMVESNTFINNGETNNYEAKLYVPCESLEAYKAHDVWGQFADIQCMPDVESAVDNVTISTTNTYKFLRNGQLLIIQDGVEYNVQGVKL